MIDRETLEFIRLNYIKKNWELELDSLRISEAGYEVDVYQKSARNRRRVGRFTGGLMHNGEYSLNNYELSGLPEKVVKLFYSPGVRKTSREVLRQAVTESMLQEWVAHGLLMRRVLYDTDGRTEKRTEYLMGHKLYSYMERQKWSNDREMEVRSAEWSSRLQTAYTILIQRLESNVDNQSGAAANTPLYYRTLFGSFIQEVAEGLSKSATLHDIAQVLQCSDESWTNKKVQLYADFVVALTEIAATQSQFDWKEIGARYYREIGGSKRFDLHKTAFVGALDERLGFPLHLIGLWSHGAVTPIYFAGELSGTDDFHYPQGFLHATTDLTVFRTRFRTNCHHLWLVENRAVLTRMAAEGDFLQVANSLAVGLDGQLRSGHRKLIEDVLRYSPQLKQVLVWCDADPAGFIIAKHVHELLSVVPGLKAKWIVAERDAVHRGDSYKEIYDWGSYEAEMSCRLGAEELSEQEAEMGGVKRWIQWLEV